MEKAPGNRRLPLNLTRFTAPCALARCYLIRDRICHWRLGALRMGDMGWRLWFLGLTQD